MSLEEQLAEAVATEEELDAQLKLETAQLLEELESSQAETSELIAQHFGNNPGVSEAHASMNDELARLQEEAWKLQMFMELETIKHQLAQLSAVRAELEIGEAGDGEEDTAAGNAAESEGTDATAAGDAAIVSDASQMKAPVALESDAEPQADRACNDEADDEEMQQLVIESEELQKQIDDELLVMQAELEAVRLEAAMVLERKQMLEEELLRVKKLHDALQLIGTEVEDDTVAQDALGVAEVPAA